MVLISFLRLSQYLCRFAITAISGDTGRPSMQITPRLIVPLALVALTLLSSCGGSGEPADKPDDSNSQLGPPSFEEPESSESGDFQITREDIFNAAVFEGLDKVGTADSTYREKGLSVLFRDPVNREVMVGDAINIWAVVRNTTGGYVPENPHALDVQIETQISGSIEKISTFSGLRNDSQGLWGIQPNKVVSLSQPGPTTSGSLFGWIRLECKKEGIGGYSLTARAESPVNGSYAVTADGTLNCVNPPTPTPPTPGPGKTLSIQVLEIDGLHYPFGQFFSMSQFTAGDDCSEAFIGLAPNLFQIGGTGELFPAGSPILSLENPGAANLSSSGACGFGAVLALGTPSVDVFDVNLEIFEKFCGNYEKNLVPEALEKDVRVGISMLRTCDQGLRILDGRNFTEGWRR